MILAAGQARQYFAPCDTNMGLKWRLEHSYCFVDGVCSSHRAFRVIAMRLGCAEYCHDRIANMLINGTAKLCDDAIGHLEITAEQPVGLFRIQLIGDAREAHNV